ncbi:alpha/beta hydrolase-fold protein [Streptomyces sp. NPDC006365]|uniref:alpha/beta hydrolase-fold protein n=1 Tax=Streptomyces sp. NPDC006365 TaxID=3364744 RepID=UPI003686E3F3
MPHQQASYAARHADLFGAVGSFSGDVDHQNVEMRTTIEQLHPSLWGPWARQEVRWRGDNPWDLAANLAHTDVSLYTGNGQTRQDGEAVDRTEQRIRQERTWPSTSACWTSVSGTGGTTTGPAATHGPTGRQTSGPGYRT